MQNCIMMHPDFFHRGVKNTYFVFKTNLILKIMEKMFIIHI